MRRIHNLWAYHVNIRIRLVLWYLLSVGLILLLFASILHGRMDRTLQDQVDTALELAAAQALDHVAERDGRLVFRDADALGRIVKEFDVRLIAPDGAAWDSLAYADAPLPAALTPGYTTIREGRRRRDGEWRVYSQQVTLSATTGWLQVAHSLEYTGTTLRSLGGHMLLTVPLLLILAGGGSLFLASRALRPIDQITQTAQAISARDLGERINYQGLNDEVGRLARTFDDMLNRLQAGFEREKRFAADAAHELRTPLTALKGRIGVTLSRSRQPDEYREALQDMEGQVDRLIRLSGDLLFMARLDHRGREEQLSEIALDDLLAALADQVSPLAAAKDITLVQSVPPGLTLEGNMDLLIRLFLNLLDNAIKYTPSEGQVTLEAHEHAAHTCVSISDTGPGISPAQLPHLFERFYRAESDRARLGDYRLGERARGGAGLGLAIAREIARAHGGTLTVQSEPGKGSTFSLCMPARDDRGHALSTPKMGDRRAKKTSAV